VPPRPQRGTATASMFHPFGNPHPYSSSPPLRRAGLSNLFQTEPRRLCFWGHGWPKFRDTYICRPLLDVESSEQITATVANVGGDQMHLIPKLSKIGGDAFHGSHRVVAPMEPVCVQSCRLAVNMAPLHWLCAPCSNRSIYHVRRA